MRVKNSFDKQGQNIYYNRINVCFRLCKKDYLKQNYGYRGFWDLKKTELKKIAQQYNCKGSPTDAKIPQWRIHKPKIAEVGPVKTALAGGPLVQRYDEQRYEGY